MKQLNEWYELIIKHCRFKLSPLSVPPSFCRAKKKENKNSLFWPRGSTNEEEQRKKGLNAIILDWHTMAKTELFIYFCFTCYALCSSLRLFVLFVVPFSVSFHRLILFHSSSPFDHYRIQSQVIEKYPFIGLYLRLYNNDWLTDWVCVGSSSLDVIYHQTLSQSVWFGCLMNFIQRLFLSVFHCFVWETKKKQFKNEKKREWMFLYWNKWTIGAIFDPINIEIQSILDL